MTDAGIDPSRCPRCGRPNSCVMAPTSAGGAAGAEPCWCTRVVVPGALLGALPDSAKGVACLCAACIAEFDRGSA